MNNSILLVLGGALLLSGCAPVAVFSTATSVGTAAAEERGVGGVISDATITTQINGSWLSHDSTLNQNIELQVREGRVLLSGAVDNVQQQIDAVRLAWKVRGVREVIDETTVSEGTGVTGYASDSWVSAKVKSKLLFEENVVSINYNVKTVAGTVYLIGIAQNQAELDKVLQITKGTDGVRKIVNYVRLKDDFSGQANKNKSVNTDMKGNIEGAPIEGAPIEQNY